MARWAFARVAPASRPRPLSLGKRVVFSVVTLILVWGMLEAGSFLLLSLAHFELFSWSGMQGRRDERLSQMETKNATRFAQVHPYVGYVEEPRRLRIPPFAGEHRSRSPSMAISTTNVRFRREGPTGS